MRPLFVLLALGLALPGCLSVDPDSGIEGTVTIGACPIEEDDPDCADEPYAADLHVLTDAEREFVEEFRSNDNGTFRVAVAPGTYVIRSAGFERVHCEAGPITVESGRYVEAQVQCNNTMR